MNKKIFKINNLLSSNSFLYLFLITIFMGSNFFKFNILNTNFNFSRILMIIIAIMYICKNRENLFERYSQKDINFCLKFFSLWSFYSIITLIFSKDIKMYIIMNFFVVIGTINILYFVRNVKINSIINNCFKIISFSSLINCLYYFILFYIFKKNIGGFYHNSNDLASFLLISMPCSLHLFFNEKNKNKMYMLILLINILSFFSIKSRGCFLGLFFAIIFLLIIYIIKNRKKIFKNKIITGLLFGIILLIFAFAIYFCNKYIGFIKFQPVKYPGKSNEIRVNLIYNGFYFLNQGFNWITGIGAGNSYYYLKYLSKHSTRKIYSFHNFWLDILVTYGLIITIGFIISFFLLIRKSIKMLNDKNNQSICLVFLFFMLSFLLACISSSTILTREWFWIVLAIIISYLNRNGEKNEKYNFCNNGSSLVYEKW